MIAPLRPCYLVWPKEGRKWKEFSKLRVGILHGKNKDKVLDGDYDYYVVNPEGLEWLCGRLAEMDEFPFDELILDESSKFKDMRTKRYSLIEKLVPMFARRWILTGSPRPKSLLNLFGPVYIMDQGATFGRRYFAFREKYFYPTGYGGYDWQLKKGADDQIYAALAPRVLVLAEKDSDVGLKPVDYNDIEVELPPKARAVYNQLEQELFVMFSAGKVSAANIAVATMKARQAAGGALYLDNGKVQPLHDAKLEALANLVEEQEGQPLIIMYQFEHEVHAIRKFLRQPNMPRLGGGITATASARLEEAWNDGQVPLMLAHELSMGHGLNLQEVEASLVWYSMTWSYDNYDQTYQRIWRSGQTGKVVVHHLLALDTIDELMRANVKHHAKAQGSLMAYFAEYWREREIA